jgi:hypothetical protein
MRTLTTFILTMPFHGTRHADLADQRRKQRRR